MSNLNTGRAFLTAGNLPAARKIALEALEQNPEDANAWELRVDIEMAAGDHAQALRLIRSRLAQTPERSKLRIDEILCLTNLGRKDEVETALGTFRRDMPYMETHAQILSCLYEVKHGSLEEGNRLFQELSKRDVEKSLLLQIELMIRSRLGDRFGRAAVCIEWVQNEPQDAQAREWLALSQFELLEYKAARKSARAALSLDPSRRLPHAMLWLTGLAWLPPFLAYETIAYLSDYARSVMGARWARPVQWIISIVIMVFTLRILGAVFKTGFVGIAVVGGVIAWPFIKAGILKLYGSRTAVPPVTLKDY